MGPSVDERTAGQERRRRQFRVRALMIVVAIAGLGFGFLRLPGVAGVLALLLAALGITLAVMLGVMALSLLGFGLFALFDRISDGARSAGEWPTPDFDEELMAR